jgi:hypothetical protein
MGRLAADPQLRARLSDGGAVTVGDFRPGVVAAQVEQLYRDLVPSQAGDLDQISSDHA